mgnify:CR=1 FL=1
MADIHPTAIIGDNVEIGENVEIGPYAIIEDNVKIGNGCQIKSYANILSYTKIGDNSRIFQHSVIGEIPQDLKFGGEKTETIIGKNTTIREFVTINRGTKDRQRTVIGDDCLLMAYVHVAHDCLVGDNVILANAATLAGHVTVEDWAILGGLFAVHQFVRIGRHSFCGGHFRTTKDIPPYILAADEPIKYKGLNVVGLRRRGFSPEARKKIKRAYKLIYRSKYNVSDAVEKIKKEFERTPEIENILKFMDSSDRGIIG